MSSEQQTPQKASRVGSTVAPTIQPYRIPTEMISDNKNLKTMLAESKVSVAQNYFYRTKYESNAKTDVSYQLRKSPKPKIQNKLHLQLPYKQKVQVKEYVGEQKQFENSVGSFFSKIFKSCLQPKQQQNYKQCEYCQHRYYNEEDSNQKKQRQLIKKQKAQPYLSYKRLVQRQKQPIQVFYQQITNQPIQNNRWESNYGQFKKIRDN